MKRGLVIGKFILVHEGHLALIRFAKHHCDELIVSMSYTTRDPIDHQLRLKWLKELLQHESKIIVEESVDDFDRPELSLQDRTAIWATFIRNRFPKIDILFSSEDYGEPFARHLGIPHRSFNITRDIVPISATQIRNNPFQYWQFIPAVVRPYFVKKICFYGTESTGKSTMAQKLAKLYHTEFVPEVARELITSNDFTVDDIVKIGYAQQQRIAEKTAIANKLLFCDTDLITTQIYSQHYLHQVPDVLSALEKQTSFDAYFFFDIDTPWISDGLRDLGDIDQRQKMKETFLHELTKRKISFKLLSGTWEEKESIIRSFIKQRWGLIPNICY